MMQSFYSAAAGMRTQNRNVDIIANNIANINTFAYKSTRASFKDTLYGMMNNPENPASNAKLGYGCGAALCGTTHLFTQGGLSYSGNDLDLYIDGDGFFMVEGNGGEPAYTRNGCFAVSNQEGGDYLVTLNGDYVLDENKERIMLPQGTEAVSVDESGAIFLDDDTLIARLNVVTFRNKDGLAVAGQSTYTATEASGEAIESDATVKQGYLESSNVDLVNELSMLITAQKAFSAASKALSTTDDMISSASNMRL